jgi:hypothetical protein
MDISVRFRLTTFQPGSRGYNNAIFEPETKFLVSVDVPIKYFVNAEKLLLEPVAGNKTPEPILTIEGWAYIEDQFLTRGNAKVDKPKDEQIDWEEDT